jgi:threonine dehydratase
MIESGLNIKRADIEATAVRIAPYVRRTPVTWADGADFGIEAGRIAFKLEFLQHAGSFKTRGAFSNLLSGTTPSAGVVAASGGNHGAAVAYAAGRLGVKATIFVPATTSNVKRERILGYGADLRLAGDCYDDALAASQEFVHATGARPIHAFDQLATILGQGTIGVEFEQDAPTLDAMLISVGGGGLIGGVAAWYRAHPRTRLFGVEPEQAPTLARALDAGEPVDSPAGGIAADSLGPKRLGRVVFPLLKQVVSGALLVSDDAIRDAQRALWRVLRVVVEPGGAAAFAALLCGRWRPNPDESVGVLLCGANTNSVNFD